MNKNQKLTTDDQRPEIQELNTMSESEAMDHMNHIRIKCGGCMKDMVLHVDQINFLDNVPFCPYCQADIDELEDELNPSMMFQTIETDLLKAIAAGDIDPIALAKAELKSRGMSDKKKKVEKKTDDGHVTVTMTDEDGKIIRTWTIGNGFGLEGTPMDEEDLAHDFYADESGNDWEHIAEIMDVATDHFKQ